MNKLTLNIINISYFLNNNSDAINMEITKSVMENMMQTKNENYFNYIYISLIYLFKSLYLLL